MHFVNSENKPNYLPVQDTIELLCYDFEAVIDDSCQQFKQCNNLPPYYDEEKFKKGQQFFHRQISGMFISKLLGLLSIMSTPSMADILAFTNMSSTPVTAYKRYVATIFHMCVWYENDFKPGSKLWQSINAVNSLHNFASNRICTARGNRILQKDMGITQFGFMGLAIARPEKVGISNASREELESFIHLWRVIGYIMGMDDKYNICRESLEETREICEGLINKVLLENLKRPTKTYLMLAEAFISGMWTIKPFLQISVFRSYLHEVLAMNGNNNSDSNELPRIKLNIAQQILLFAIKVFIYSIRFKPVKLLANYAQYATLWSMKNFPLLALYMYGYEKSFVSIFIERKEKTG